MSATSLLCLALPIASVPSYAWEAPSDTALDSQVTEAMAANGAKGLAIAVIDRGAVVKTGAYGKRNAKGDPLETHTVMVGASLTKAVFAYAVMQLVEEGELDLDRSIAEYLPKPLPE